MTLFDDIARAQQRDGLRKDAVSSILKTLDAFSHDEKLLIMGALANELESGRAAPPMAPPAAPPRVFKLPPRPVAPAVQEPLDDDAGPTALVRQALAQANGPLTPADAVQAVLSVRKDIPPAYVYSALNKMKKVGRVLPQGDGYVLNPNYQRGRKAEAT
jgi:hypothetical protein